MSRAGDLSARLVVVKNVRGVGAIAWSLRCLFFPGRGRSYFRGKASEVRNKLTSRTPQLAGAVPGRNAIYYSDLFIAALCMSAGFRVSSRARRARIMVCGGDKGTWYGGGRTFFATRLVFPEAITPAVGKNLQQPTSCFKHLRAYYSYSAPRHCCFPLYWAAQK